MCFALSHLHPISSVNPSWRNLHLRFWRVDTSTLYPSAKEAECKGVLIYFDEIEVSSTLGLGQFLTWSLGRVIIRPRWSFNGWYPKLLDGWSCSSFRDLLPGFWRVVALQKYVWCNYKMESNNITTCITILYESRLYNGLMILKRLTSPEQGTCHVVYNEYFKLISYKKESSIRHGQTFTVATK